MEECRHPLRFWAVYRARVRDRLNKKPSGYRCPVCGVRLEMEPGIPLLAGMVDGVIIVLAVLAAVGIERLLLRANVGLWRGPLLLATCWAATYLLYIPVCYIGLRLGRYVICESDGMPL